MWYLCLTSLQIILLPIQIAGKIDEIKWWLNFMSCNFGLKSYLWFQIELPLCLRSILKSREWFQTKLHWFGYDLCRIHLEENHVPVFCTYNRSIRYTIIFWLHTWNAEDSEGENQKNLVHFCSILIVSNYAWLLIYPKMSSWELINTMMTAILISPRSIALAMGGMQNMHSTQFNYHYLSLFVCIQNHVSYRGFLHLTLCLSTCF